MTISLKTHHQVEKNVTPLWAKVFHLKVSATQNPEYIIQNCRPPLSPEANPIPQPTTSYTIPKNGVCCAHNTLTLFLFPKVERLVLWISVTGCIERLSCVLMCGHHRDLTRRTMSTLDTRPSLYSSFSIFPLPPYSSCNPLNVLYLTHFHWSFLNIL
jgi:hypothetical protein